VVQDKDGKQPSALIANLKAYSVKVEKKDG
jgi:hypothetical protein